MGAATDDDADHVAFGVDDVGVGDGRHGAAGEDEWSDFFHVLTLKGAECLLFFGSHLVEIFRGLRALAHGVEVHGEAEFAGVLLAPLVEILARAVSGEGDDRDTLAGILARQVLV